MECLDLKTFSKIWHGSIPYAEETELWVLVATFYSLLKRKDLDSELNMQQSIEQLLGVKTNKAPAMEISRQ